METHLPSGAAVDAWLRNRVGALVGALATCDSREAHRILSEALDRAYEDGFADGFAAGEAGEE